jgi:hypothetical protein
LRCVEFPHHRLGAAALGRKENLDRRQGPRRIIAALQENQRKTGQTEYKPFHKQFPLQFTVYGLRFSVGAFYLFNLQFAICNGQFDIISLLNRKRFIHHSAFIIQHFKKRSGPDENHRGFHPGQGPCQVAT